MMLVNRTALDRGYGEPNGQRLPHVLDRDAPALAFRDASSEDTTRGWIPAAGRSVRRVVTSDGVRCNTPNFPRPQHEWSNAMIKRLTVMTRRPGLSKQEFADYWTNIHAPLLASHPAVKRLVLNVTEQFVRFSVRNEDPADALRSTVLTQTPDGFVELWFADRESMEAMYKSDFSKQLVADAEHFVGAIATFIVDERDITATTR
jgi:uncharacterized protein (TIGR02118 family)